MIHSELRLDVVNSSQLDSLYTRTTSYVYEFVVDDSVLHVQSSHIDDTQPSPPQMVSSQLLNQGEISFSLSFLVREYKQHTAGKALLFSAAIQSSRPISLCIFAPLWLLPPASKFSRLSIARESDSALELLLTHNALSDLYQVTLDPAILESLIPLWLTLYRRTIGRLKLTQTKAEEDYRLVLLQAGSIQAGSTLQITFETLRYINGKETDLHELFKYVYVFWHSEKERKFGYLPLTQLCMDYDSSLLRSVRILLESERVRYTDFVLCDAKGTTMKFTMQGTLRVYHVSPDTQLGVVYAVTDTVKKPNTSHQM